jgi:hypothetical protein
MRYRLFFCLVLATAAALVPAGRCGEKSERRTFHLQWRDLERATRGYRIGLLLPSGIRLQGDVVAFEADELVLDVRKTSDKRAYPKGRSIVPRAEVTRLQIIKTRTTWRKVGTVIGGSIGAGLAVPMVVLAQEGGSNAALTGILSVAVPAGAGYLLGWAADVDVVEIVVDPEPRPDGGSGF